MKFLILALALAGCEASSSSGDVTTVDPCLTSGSVAAVEGTWTLSGSGERDNCPGAYEDLNTSSFNIKMPALTVAQDADGKLTAPIPTPQDVQASFAGSVRGTCVSAQLTEIDARGVLPVTRKWTFEGDSASGFLTGTFTVVGPETCSGSGRFAVSVR